MTINPTDIATAINALEEPLRSYITELETNHELASIVRDAAQQRENARALAERVREFEAERAELGAALVSVLYGQLDLRTAMHRFEGESKVSGDVIVRALLRAAKEG